MVVPTPEPAGNGNSAPTNDGPGVHVQPDAAPEERVSVIIADSDPLSRRVIRDVLQNAPGIVVAAEATDGVETVELVRHYQPAVLITELKLGRVDGLTVVRKLREEAPDVKVIVFTVMPDDDQAIAVLRAGAVGVLSKDVPVESLARAVRGAHRGEAAISRTLMTTILDRMRRIPEGMIGMRPVKSTLTPREWEVLDLVSNGSSTHDVANKLVVTDDTIYSHMKNVMRKLDVHTRAEAVALAEGLRQP